MISENEFIETIKNLRDCDQRISEAESSLGFEISTNGAVADIYNIVYTLLKSMSNVTTEKEEIQFFDDLGMILFIYPFPEEDMLNFYNKYYKEVK